VVNLKKNNIHVDLKKADKVANATSISMILRNDFHKPTEQADYCKKKQWQVCTWVMAIYQLVIVVVALSTSNIATNKSK